MHPKGKKLPLTEFTELSTDNSNPKSIPKDAYGYDAITNYLSLDNLGINALPDSEKYKRGIKENRTGRTRTLGIWMECPKCGISRHFQEFIPKWMECPKCGISRHFQEFIPNEYGIELGEEIERKECPNPDCKSKNFSIIMHDKDTVFYPNNALKGSHSMALLF
jgi:predicted RNA-binding Zn-ribbon protein involved in translation (DUF1610 family)